MKKIRVVDLVDFRHKSDRSKKNFATRIRLNKPEPTKAGGGDYWTSAVSGIARASRKNDNSIVDLKIKQIQEKIEETKTASVKAMRLRNIEVLLKYPDFKFSRWFPKSNVTFLKNPKTILTVVGLPVESSPNHVFLFGKEGHLQVGAIWIIAKKGGFNKSELGMFSDILRRYLRVEYGTKYSVSSRFCIAVDAYNCVEVNYSQISNGELDNLLGKTLGELKKLM